MRFVIIALVIVLPASMPGIGIAQSTGIASATPVNISTGTPNTFAIKQQIISRQEAEIRRQLTQVTRCIHTASLNVVLTDPTGQINKVPQTDLINCRRELIVLERKLQRLARAADQLSRDAQARAIALETQARLALLRQNLRALASSIFASSANSLVGN